MKKILKCILILLFAVSFSVCSFIPSFAAPQKGSITVNLEDKENNKIDGLEVFLCHVAELNSTGYYPTAPFESSGISIAGLVNRPDDFAAKSVLTFIKENHVNFLSKLSENGKAVFTDLPLGIYLAYCGEEGSHTFNPYLVFLPYKSGGGLQFQITGSPKVEVNEADEITVSVIKKWDDDNNAPQKRPSSVTVQLLNGETVVATALLGEENGWTHLFTNLSKDGSYSVREEDVSDYKATYSGDAENGFVIVNTYVGEKLPQTGQYWWPIILIAIAGIGFIILGIYETAGKKNEKKK